MKVGMCGCVSSKEEKKEEKEEKEDIPAKQQHEALGKGPMEIVVCYGCGG